VGPVAGHKPTDRGKNGSKRHLLVNGRGVPSSLIVTGANAHGVTQIEAVLDAIVVSVRRQSSAAPSTCASVQAIEAKAPWR
jgi:hypothetical protein